VNYTRRQILLVGGRGIELRLSRAGSIRHLFMWVQVDTDQTLQFKLSSTLKILLNKNSQTCVNLYLKAGVCDLRSCTHLIIFRFQQCRADVFPVCQSIFSVHCRLSSFSNVYLFSLSRCSHRFAPTCQVQIKPFSRLEITLESHIQILESRGRTRVSHPCLRIRHQSSQSKLARDKMRQNELYSYLCVTNTPKLK
jgi:hypothetical protein